LSVDTVLNDKTSGYSQTFRLLNDMTGIDLSH